jgi:hypothetical protein
MDSVEKHDVRTNMPLKVPDKHTYCTLAPQCHLMYNTLLHHAHILGIRYLGEIHSEISYSLLEFQFRYFRS